MNTEAQRPSLPPGPNTPSSSGGSAGPGPDTPLARPPDHQSRAEQAGACPAPADPPGIPPLPPDVPGTRAAGHTAPQPPFPCLPGGPAAGQLPAPRHHIGTAPKHAAPPAHSQAWTDAYPETLAETTTRSGPGRVVRPAGAVASVVCVILGLGLIGGAVTGSWLTGRSAAETVSSNAQPARSLWHSVPVEELFPRTLKGDDAGPGGADRTWTRLAAAPDSGCDGALDPALFDVVRTVGCERLVRATYTDATSSFVTTVGLVFTQGDAAATQALQSRFVRDQLAERAGLLPRTFPVPGTAAAGFGQHQRASWTVKVLDDAPVVVYAVSGFADGRTVTDPQPADRAMAAGATGIAAQAGLGHEAKGIADRIARGLRKSISAAGREPR